jgi:hypothetical protein
MAKWHDAVTLGFLVVVATKFWGKIGENPTLCRSGIDP